MSTVATPPSWHSITGLSEALEQERTGQTANVDGLVIGVIEDALESHGGGVPDETNRAFRAIRDVYDAARRGLPLDHECGPEFRAGQVAALADLVGIVDSRRTRGQAFEVALRAGDNRPVIRLLHRERELRADDLIARLGGAPETVRERLDTLCTAGVLVVQRSGRDDYWRLGLAARAALDEALRLAVVLAPEAAAR